MHRHRTSLFLFGELQPDGERLGPQQAGDTIRPLYQGDPIAVQPFVQPERQEFVSIAQPVQIEMVDRPASDATSVPLAFP